MSKFWTGTQHPALASDSRPFPSFLHTYGASGAFKNMRQMDIYRYMDHTGEQELLESKSK